MIRRTMLIRAAVILVALLSAWFLVAQLVENWAMVRSHLREPDPAWTAIAAASSAAGMWSFALLWRASLRLVHEERSRREVSAWFFAGELAKYLPGGLWGVAGRSELAHLAGIRRQKAYASTLLAIGLMVLGGALAALLLAPWAIRPPSPVVRLVATAGVLLGVVLVTHPRATTAVLAATRRITKGRVTLAGITWGIALRTAVAAVVPWVWAGVSAVALMTALGFTGSPISVALAAIVAWVVGVLAVPVPAGAGIREASFVVLSGMDPSQAAALALLMRTLLIVIDAAAGLVAIPLLRRQQTGLPTRRVESS